MIFLFQCAELSHLDAIQCAPHSLLRSALLCSLTPTVADDFSPHRLCLRTVSPRRLLSRIPISIFTQFFYAWHNCLPMRWQRTYVFECAPDQNRSVATHSERRHAAAPDPLSSRATSAVVS